MIYLSYQCLEGTELVQGVGITGQTLSVVPVQHLEPPPWDPSVLWCFGEKFLIHYHAGCVFSQMVTSKLLLLFLIAECVAADKI